jgi:hypothetical protein
MSVVSFVRLGSDCANCCDDRTIMCDSRMSRCGNPPDFVPEEICK